MNPDELGGLAFYTEIECPACDAEIHHGPNISWLTHRGLPVVPADMFSQFDVDCPECGKTVYLGEITVFIDDSDEKAEAVHG